MSLPQAADWLATSGNFLLSPCSQSSGLIPAPATSQFSKLRWLSARLRVSSASVTGTLRTVDADGVALAAIQGLNAKLEAENAALRSTLDALTARLARLEAARQE